MRVICHLISVVGASFLSILVNGLLAYAARAPFVLAPVFSVFCSHLTSRATTYRLTNLQCRKCVLPNLFFVRGLCLP
ncbi:hypothetical protein DFH11DRAFT_1629646 [Phellopilus nigrolimitatus]|nr:hypothetical protein DFH11DRAFT_1629646 [Phellopilus nigrolimitatus]